MTLNALKKKKQVQTLTSFIVDTNLITFDLKWRFFQFLWVPITGSDVSQRKPRGVDLTSPKWVRCWLGGDAKNTKNF